MTHNRWKKYESNTNHGMRQKNKRQKEAKELKNFHLILDEFRFAPDIHERGLFSSHDRPVASWNPTCAVA